MHKCVESHITRPIILNLAERLQLALPWWFMTRCTSWWWGEFRHGVRGRICFCFVFLLSVATPTANYSTLCHPRTIHPWQRMALHMGSIYLLHLTVFVLGGVTLEQLLIILVAPSGTWIDYVNFSGQMCSRDKKMFFFLCSPINFRFSSHFLHPYLHPTVAGEIQWIIDINSSLMDAAPGNLISCFCSCQLIGVYV